MNPSALVLDIESAKAVLKRGERPEINPVTEMPYEYVNGFDAPDMGISVIGTWDLLTNEPPDWYFGTQIEEMGKAIEQRGYVVTYNGDGFDLPHIAHAGLDIPKWKSIDMAAMLYEMTGVRCSLGDLAMRNLNIGKSGSGKDAPLVWQRYCADRFNYQFELANLVNYCRQDVGVTRRLFLRALKNGGLEHPKTGSFVALTMPEGLR